MKKERGRTKGRMRWCGVGDGGRFAGERDRRHGGAHGDVLLGVLYLRSLGDWVVICLLGQEEQVLVQMCLIPFHSHHPQPKCTIRSTST